VFAILCVRYPITRPHQGQSRIPLIFTSASKLRKAPKVLRLLTINFVDT
jgi:hypothetical protein